MNTDLQASPFAHTPFDLQSGDRAAFDAIPYDECVERLALAVDRKDDADLGEMARLIGQLAVVIEI